MAAAVSATLITFLSTIRPTSAYLWNVINPSNWKSSKRCASEMTPTATPVTGSVMFRLYATSSAPTRLAAMPTAAAANARAPALACWTSAWTACANVSQPVPVCAVAMMAAKELAQMTAKVTRPVAAAAPPMSVGVRPTVPASATVLTAAAGYAPTTAKATRPVAVAARSTCVAVPRFVMASSAATPMVAAGLVSQVPGAALPVVSARFAVEATVAAGRVLVRVCTPMTSVTPQPTSATVRPPTASASPAA